jgi:hypothetical protein
MMASMAVFGLGGESLSVAQKTMLASLDEGLLSLTLSNLLYMENPYNRNT